MKKGIIRWKSIFLICISIFTILYFSVFIKIQIKKYAEQEISKAYGAQVNIEDFDYAFLNSRASINQVQFTDIDNPKLNLVVFEKITFEFSTYELLKMNVLIDIISIENVEFKTLRDSPGKIYRVKQTNSEEKKEDTLTNALNLLGVKNPSISKEDISKASSKTLSKIENINLKINNQEKSIKEIKNSIGQINFDTEIKSIKIKKFKDLKVALKKIKTIVKNIKTLKNTHSGNLKEFKNSISTLKSDVKELQKSIKEDKNNLAKNFKIPKINTKNLANDLFYKHVQKFLNIINSFNKNVDEKSTTSLRHRGKRIYFPTKDSSPPLLINKILLSSQSNNLKGEIHHISSHPVKETIVFLSGDIPKLEMNSIKLNYTGSFHQKIPQHVYSLFIGSMKINNFYMVKNENLEFGLSKPRLSTSIQGSFKQNSIDTQARVSFLRTNFLIKAKKKIVQRLLEVSTSKSNQVKITVIIKGVLPRPKISIESSLVQDIHNGIYGTIKGKINNIRNKLNGDYDKRVRPKILEVENKIGNVNEKYNSIHNKIMKKLGKQEKMANDKKSEKPKILKKPLDVLKKFKF